MTSLALPGLLVQCRLIRNATLALWHCGRGFSKLGCECRRSQGWTGVQQNRSVMRAAGYSLRFGKGCRIVYGGGQLVGVSVSDEGVFAMFGRRNALTLALLATALGLIALCLVALACAPAAPSGQAAGQAEPDAPLAATATPTVRWLGDTPSASELATIRAIPTATPYPPGYVKPIDLPTYTPVPPWPTQLARLLAVESALQTREASSGVGGAAGAGAGRAEVSATEAALDSVAKHVAIGEYDAIARVRVLSSRDVMVAEHGTDPSSKLEKARRFTVAVVTTYRGTLPAQFDIVSFEAFSTDDLDAGREYILGVYRLLIPESEYTASEPWRAAFSPEALAAAGGEAYSYNVRMAWIIDGQTARRVPPKYFHGGMPGYGSHLEAARISWAFALPLPTIEDALKRAAP